MDSSLSLRTPLLIPLLLAALLLLAVAATSGTEGQIPSPPHVQCAEKLAAMSSCLPHVGALPENVSSAPSAACCQAFSTVLNGAGGGGACLCDAVREPSLLGSPVNASALASLFSSCGKSDGVAASTFAEICRNSVGKLGRRFPPHLASTSKTTKLTGEPEPKPTEEPVKTKPPGVKWPSPSRTILPAKPGHHHHHDCSSRTTIELLLHGALVVLLSFLTL